MDDAPAWEHREVQRHFDESTATLFSDYLSAPLNLSEALRRRRNGEPLEYILKHTHIGDLTVKTDPRALVPRPETETLIRRFTRQVSDLPPGPIIDCGTGSGFMAGWLCQHTRRTVVATDRDRNALSLARENRSLHHWRYHLVRADRLGPFQNRSAAGIVANLPYVSPGDPDLQPNVMRYEPKTALFAGRVPSHFYHVFIDQAARVLCPGGAVRLELTPELVRTLHANCVQNEVWETVLTERDSFDRLRYLILNRGTMDPIPDA